LILLENRLLSAKNESNEILTDLIRESDNANNDYVTKRILDHGSQNGASKQSSIPIELKEFIIDKPNEPGYKNYNGNNL
jgi:hypothetical protein